MWWDVVSANHLIPNTAPVGSRSEDIEVISGWDTRTGCCNSQEPTTIETHWRHDRSTKGQELMARKRNHGRDWGWGMKRKKASHPWSPNRPPVVFQPVSFTGLGKWSTAASLTYIVCIMPLLKLPGRGEGCWTLIWRELLRSLHQLNSLSAA